MREFAPIWLAACLVLAGCDQRSTSNQTAPADSRDVPSAASGVAAQPDRGNGYRVEIVYPELQSHDAPLAEALHAYAARARRDFFANLAQRRDAADPQRIEWSLHLEFRTHADTKDWLSVIASGETYTGGAHGNPLLAGFTLHRTTQRLVSIADLFQNSESGLRALSNFARQSLAKSIKPVDGDSDSAQRRIVDGTEPRVENFANFAIANRADGIVLLFPPYQVASYADGVHELEVPLRVFAANLKPELRDSFATTARR